MFQCSLCNALYIGQTARFFKHRMHEHLNRTQSAVYQHHAENHSHVDINTIYTTEIIHTNLTNKYQKRVTVEAV